MIQVTEEAARPTMLKLWANSFSMLPLILLCLFRLSVLYVLFTDCGVPSETTKIRPQILEKFDLEFFSEDPAENSTPQSNFRQRNGLEIWVALSMALEWRVLGGA